MTEIQAAKEVMIKINEAVPNSTSYIVGGAVRDMAMGLSPKDIDITTSVPIATIEQHFNCFDIGKNKEFGIVVVSYKGYSFEVSNYRNDEESDTQTHNHAHSTNSSFETDSNHRDFTINAMGCDLNETIVDFHDGKEDISNKIINTVGEPEQRFAEDYIRIIRAIRFAARFDFTISPEVEQAITQYSHRIPETVSVERIWAEMHKMAASPNFWKAMVMMVDLNVMVHIIPEIATMDEFDHDPKWHPEGNVWVHTIEVLKKLEDQSAICKLAGLFHDIGKPRAFDDSNGKISYKMHEHIGLSVFDEIAQRLKISRSDQECIKSAIGNHMKMHSFMQMKHSSCYNLITSPHWDILEAVSYADAASRGDIFNQDEWNQIVQKIDNVTEKAKSKNKINAFVNGKLVFKYTNAKPGPEMGIIIRKTKEFVIDNNIDLDLEQDQNAVISFVQSIGDVSKIE